MLPVAERNKASEGHQTEQVCLLSQRLLQGNLRSKKSRRWQRHPARSDRTVYSARIPVAVERCQNKTTDFVSGREQQAGEDAHRIPAQNAKGPQNDNGNYPNLDGEFRPRVFIHINHPTFNRDTWHASCQKSLGKSLSRDDAVVTDEQRRYRIRLVNNMIGVVAAHACGEHEVGYGTGSATWSLLKPQKSSGRRPSV